MLIEKTNVSARVDTALKTIVEDSEFSHKDTYELGAKLIVSGNAELFLITIESNTNYIEIEKRTRYKLIKAKKNKLEKELRDM